MSATASLSGWLTTIGVLSRSFAERRETSQRCGEVIGVVDDLDPVKPPVGLVTELLAQHLCWSTRLLCAASRCGALLSESSDVAEAADCPAGSALAQIIAPLVASSLAAVLMLSAGRFGIVYVVCGRGAVALLGLSSSVWTTTSGTALNAGSPPGAEVLVPLRHAAPRAVRPHAA
jgi:hypothetical protein